MKKLFVKKCNKDDYTFKRYFDDVDASKIGVYVSWHYTKKSVSKCFDKNTHHMGYTLIKDILTKVESCAKLFNSISDKDYHKFIFGESPKLIKKVRQIFQNYCNRDKEIFSLDECVSLVKLSIRIVDFRENWELTDNILSEMYDNLAEILTIINHRDYSHINLFDNTGSRIFMIIAPKDIINTEFFNWASAVLANSGTEVKICTKRFDTLDEAEKNGIWDYKYLAEDYKDDDSLVSALISEDFGEVKDLSKFNITVVEEKN